MDKPIKETLKVENPLEPSLMAKNMHTKKEEVVLIPRTLGDDKGLRVDPCTNKPAKAKEAPAKSMEPKKKTTTTAQVVVVCFMVRYPCYSESNVRSRYIAVRLANTLLQRTPRTVPYGGVLLTSTA